MKKTIGFIGAGNMASSLIGGLLASGYPLSHLLASNLSLAALESLATLGIYTTTDNLAVANAADILVLCVKPKDMATLCSELANILTQKNTLVLSIAAGITTAAIQQWTGNPLPLVRTMPNTPALVGAAMTGLYATPQVNPAQRACAEEIMRAVGAILWVETESQLDIVTALSGSGPAYFLYFMEALRDAGIQLGLSAEAAHFLVGQTAFGAAKLALENNETWSSLRQKITSPGGTTEQAIQAFTPHLTHLCKKAVDAAYHRSQALSKEI